jgi:ABC-type antimicrobial peptide transport system permease subunit
MQSHSLLRQDFTSVGLLRLMYDFPQAGVPAPIRLGLAGQPDYSIKEPPQVADNEFLSNVALPLYARARGFTSDQQVWNAVRSRQGDVVLQYDSSVDGLPGSSDFTPFIANIPDSSMQAAHYHRVTVIGLMPASAPWRMLLSQGTSASIAHPPYIQFINTYLFQLRQGVSETRAAQDLNHELQASLRGIAVQSLDQGSLNGVTEVLTLLLSGELNLGLLFGALAIGVITARAVVERRQQIGMLRALGFSRTLIRRSFLLEAGFIILLSLLIGASLALGLAAQVARATYQDFPFPVIPIVLILSGSFLVALISTALPAWQAAHLQPAEALRYE